MAGSKRKWQKTKNRPNQRQQQQSKQNRNIENKKKKRNGNEEEDSVQMCKLLETYYRQSFQCDCFCSRITETKNSHQLGILLHARLPFGRELLFMFERKKKERKKKSRGRKVTKQTNKIENSMRKRQAKEEKVKELI